MAYYRTDIDICNTLDLWGREAMVYSALLYLCKAAPYKGTITELSNFSRCGNWDTTLRMLNSLIAKGYVVRSEKGLIIPQFTESHPQNTETNPQNTESHPQNTEISKEKRTKKENIIKENEESVCDNTHARTLVFDKNKIFEPPLWKDWEAFAREHKIELLVYQKAWCYYMMRGWRDVLDWKAALMYWDLKNKT